MTQEEIEALMSGTIADSADETSSAEEDIVSDENNIDDILAGIDGVIDDDKTDTNNNIDDILAGIDGIVDTKPDIEESNPATTPADELDSKIDEGIYPLPAKKEHKVVNQLNEVAEDSERKASQIFDVLSFILDQNDIIQRGSSKTAEFIDSQLVLLNTLTKKFPNVEIFVENLQKAQEAKNTMDEINNAIDDENNKVFEAMELMQFHDINRQKIERVMSVIKKLSIYLNGLFEDDSNKPEVQIAKHISGDSSEMVTEDDLDNLISEFNSH